MRSANLLKAANFNPIYLISQQFELFALSVNVARILNGCKCVSESSMVRTDATLRIEKVPQ